MFSFRSFFILTMLLTSKSILADQSDLKFKFTECVLISIQHPDGKIITEKGEIPELFSCRKINPSQYQCFISFSNQVKMNELILNPFQNSQTKLMSQSNRDFLNYGEKNVYFRSTIADSGEKICSGVRIFNK